MVEISTDIRNSIYEGKEVTAAFLDVSSAYDNVKGDILIKILKREKCPRRIIKYIEDWIWWRRIRFVVDEEEEEERSISRITTGRSI